MSIVDLFIALSRASTPLMRSFCMCIISVCCVRRSFWPVAYVLGQMSHFAIYRGGFCPEADVRGWMSYKTQRLRQSTNGQSHVTNGQTGKSVCRIRLSCNTVLCILRKSEPGHCSWFYVQEYCQNFTATHWLRVITANVGLLWILKRLDKVCHFGLFSGHRNNELFVSL